MEWVGGRLGELFDGVHILLHGVRGAVWVSFFCVTLLHFTDGRKSVHSGQQPSGLHPAKEGAPLMEETETFTTTG